MLSADLPCLQAAQEATAFSGMMVPHVTIQPRQQLSSASSTGPSGRGGSEPPVLPPGEPTNGTGQAGRTGVADGPVDGGPALEPRATAQLGPTQRTGVCCAWGDNKNTLAFAKEMAKHQARVRVEEQCPQAITAGTQNVSTPPGSPQGFVFPSPHEPWLSVPQNRCEAMLSWPAGRLPRQACPCSGLRAHSLLSAAYAIGREQSAMIPGVGSMTSEDGI